MKKPYLTKIAYGRWWMYTRTRRQWKRRQFRIGRWWVVVVSYRRSAYE